jgi:hypothetical protein
MMVDGAERGQFRGPIDVLAPYTSVVDSHQSESVARRGLSFTRCGEMHGLASGGEFVLVDETAEDVAPADRATPAD